MGNLRTIIQTVFFVNNHSLLINERRLDNIVSFEKRTMYLTNDMDPIL